MNSQTGYSFRRPNSSNGFYANPQLSSIMNLQGSAFQNIGNNSFGRIQGLPPQSLPQGFSQGFPQGFPQGFSQGMPQGFNSQMFSNKNPF